MKIQLVCVGGRKKQQSSGKMPLEIQLRQDDGFSRSFPKYIMAVRTGTENTIN